MLLDPPLSLVGTSGPPVEDAVDVAWDPDVVPGTVDCALDAASDVDTAPFVVVASSVLPVVVPSVFSGC